MSISDARDFLAEDLKKVEYLQEHINECIRNGDHVANDMEALIDYTHNYYALMNYQGILWTV